jgi:hypothetical protein
MEELYIVFEMILAVSTMNILAEYRINNTTVIWGHSMLAKPSELVYTQICTVGDKNYHYKIKTAGFVINSDSDLAVNSLYLYTVSTINLKNNFSKNTINYFIKYFNNYENKYI